jgi:hypothetical protein
MITIPDLQTALLDLLHEVEGTEIRPIIFSFLDPQNRSFMPGRAWSSRKK